MTFIPVFILQSRRSLAIVAGMKKRMTTQNRQKSITKYYFFNCCILHGLDVETGKIKNRLSFNSQPNI